MGPRLGPLVLTDYDPFTLEVTIPLFYGYTINLSEEQRKTAYWNSGAWKVHKPPFKNFSYLRVREDISRWCGRNLSGRYQACYRYPREGGTNYMALSNMLDVFKFRCQMSEWNDDHY